MSYFKVLALDKELFFTNPSPAFLYGSRGHPAALIRLMFLGGSFKEVDLEILLRMKKRGA